MGQMIQKSQSEKILRKMAEQGITMAELSRRLGVPRSRLSEILHRTASVGPEVWRRIESVVETPGSDE